MKCNITFRNLDHTPALDEKIKQKSEKLNKFFGEDAHIDWICWVQREDQFAEVKVQDGKKHYNALANSDNLYKTIDMAIDKIQNQIKK